MASGISISMATGKIPFYVAQTVAEVANTVSDTKNQSNHLTPLHQQPEAKFLGLVLIVDIWHTTCLYIIAIVCLFVYW